MGASIACTMPEYAVIGFVAAFASHFVLDTIPHWDYDLYSQKSDGVDLMNDDVTIDKSFFKDLFRIGIDALLGISLSALFAVIWNPPLLPFAIIGAVAAILPDALQFAYWKWRHQPLISLQRFHIWIHSKTYLKRKPFLGILPQLAIIILAVIIFRFT